MNGAAPGAKIVSVPRLLLGRRLHQRRAHRGHDRPRRQPRRRRRQHVDRRPARAERRQQRARRALQPPDRHYGVQLFISAGNSGPGAQHHRRPGRGRQGRLASARASPRRPGAANYGSEVAEDVRMLPTSPRAARVRTAASRRTSPPRAPRVNTTPTWLPGAPVAEAGYDPAGRLRRCSRAPRWRPRRPRAPRAAAVAPAKASRPRPSPRPSCARRSTRSADLIKRRAGVRAGQRPDRRRRAPGTLLSRKHPEPATYTVTAPVCTADRPTSWRPRTRAPASTTGARRTPAARPARRSRTTVTITRTSGAGRAIRHKLTLGRQRRHLQPRRARRSLPLNKPVTVTVKAKPSAGAHSAILRIDDPSTAVVDHAMMATVVAVHGTLGRARRTRHHDRARVERNRDEVVLRHRARGRQGAAGRPGRHRDGQPDPVHRDQPVRRPGGQHHLAGLLHQLPRRHGCKPTLPCVREPDAGRLGDRGRVAGARRRRSTTRTS